jgi:glycosyltransferase involved in cell wall biosynthesis
MTMARKKPVRRILLIGTMTSPSGAPLAMLRLAGGFFANGHHVKAIFLYDREPMSGGDFPYICLLPSPPTNLIDFVHLITALWRQIGLFRPDALFGFLPFASILGCFLSRLRGVRARVSSHRVPRNTYTFVMAMLDLLSGWSGNYTDVITVSNSVKNSCGAYPKWLKRRTVTVHNGIMGWTASPFDKQAARAHFALPPHVFLMAAVGRIDIQKNYPVLIEALAGTPDHIALVIAGDGAERPGIEHRIAQLDLGNRVFLLGNRPRDDIPHLLAAADIFVQPSLFEGQSNALLEALQAGLPCFVSDAPEQIETITGEDGRIAGQVFPVNDPGAWRKGLLAASQNPDYRSSMQPIISVQARLFTFDRMMAGFEAVLDTRLPDLDHQ